MAQNDTHVALIILTTQMWGGKLLAEKTFSGQILCFCAFGANIRSYTKQRARHGTPFLQPPSPLLRRASMSPPPPRRAIFRSLCEGVATPAGLRLKGRGGHGVRAANADKTGSLRLEKRLGSRRRRLHNCCSRSESWRDAAAAQLTAHFFFGGGGSPCQAQA